MNTNLPYRYLTIRSDNKMMYHYMWTFRGNRWWVASDMPDIHRADGSRALSKRGKEITLYPLSSTEEARLYDFLVKSVTSYRKTQGLKERKTLGYKVVVIH